MAAVKSDKIDPKNRRKVEPNISKAKVEALKALINLQRDRTIVIKPCDEGRGIILLDFEDYMKACTVHLESETAIGVKYYQKVDNKVLQGAKGSITKVVQEGYNNKILPAEEFKMMTPSDNTVPGRFYGTFTVHKEHAPGVAPPIRRSSGTFTENIALYMENNIKELEQSHNSFLQDTPDFLRFIERINKEKLSYHDLLVVMDAIGLYNNIPPNDGVQCVKEKLKENQNKESTQNS